MKKSIILLAFALLTAVSCVNNKPSNALLPNVSGKAGEVLVIMDKADWEGNLGTEVRSVMGAPTPFLPQEEPLFSMVNVSKSGFSQMFKMHRNVLYFDIDPQITSSGVQLKENIWAFPQCVVQVNAVNADSASSIFKRNSELIANSIEQAERNRIINNAIKYENKPLGEAVAQVTGGTMHFPDGYKLLKKTDSFVWIADVKQYTNQGVIVYKYPVTGDDSFLKEKLLSKMDEVMKSEVPGMFDDTYMVTSTYADPSLKFIKYKGLDFAEIRGFWEVHNDFMGGPFVSHSFYSKDGKDIIVLEAFVYAPKFDKRQYLRQVESLLYSFSWVSEAKKE